MKRTVAVAGATGYAGGEALRIFASHPEFEVTCVAGHSSVGEKLGTYVPHIPQLADLVIEDTTADVLAGHDVVVLALPHGASGALAAELEAKGEDCIIIDLGADHRLEHEEAWNEFYGGQFFNNWAYGMPELIVGKNSDDTYKYQYDNLVGAKRIAGPGCNVTATTLAMQPGIAQGLIKNDIVADLVVGYSGAGKSLKKPYLLAAEAIGSAFAYSVGGSHRHIPEILQNFAHAAGAGTAKASEEFTLGFTPVLAPMSRGIMATVSAPMTDKALGMSDEEIRNEWINAYKNQDFIIVLPQGVLPSTANIIGSNAAHIQVVPDRRSKRLYAFSAIDNLNRGTAGQAIEALNIACGFNEQTGLSIIGVAP